MRRFVHQGCSVLGFLVLVAGLARLGHGQTQPQAPQREAFQAVSADEVGSAKGRVRERLSALRQRLARDPVDVQEGWTRFLMTEALQEQLEAEKPDTKATQRILARLKSDKAGMEFSPVLALRHAFAEYVELANVHQDSEPEETFGAIQDEVRELLKGFEAQPTPVDATEIGWRIGKLRRSRQAPRLVETVDGRYSRNNFLAQASRRLVAVGIDQDVDELSSISDSMLGVSIQGNVRMTGRVSLALSPNSERASLELLLNGQASSSNTGWKGPVTVYSSGLTSVAARKSLRLDDTGLNGDPASAACATSSSIDDIEARCGLIRRMAWKKAQQSQGQAESIASSKAELRIQGRVDEQAAEMLTKTNDSFQQKFRKPLVRRDGFPRSLRFSTTTDRLLVHWLQRGEAQLAAANDPPPFTGDPDLSVRVHQSYVSNLSEAAIGGVTLTDEKLADMLKDATGDVPEELRINEDKDPWSITFSEKTPISATFREDGLKIAIQGDRFTRGDTPLNKTMRISATYKFEKTATGSKLVRQGALEVEYVTGKPGQRESAQQVAFKAFMRRKFEALLKPEIVSDGIKLPGRWEKGGKLQVNEFAATQEWLSLSWDLAPVTATPDAAEKTASRARESADSPAAQVARRAP